MFSKQWGYFQRDCRCGKLRCKLSVIFSASLKEKKSSPHFRHFMFVATLMELQYLTTQQLFKCCKKSFVTFITPHITSSLYLKQILYPQKPRAAKFLQQSKYVVSYYRQRINYLKVLLPHNVFGPIKFVKGNVLVCLPISKHRCCVLWMNFA